MLGNAEARQAFFDRLEKDRDFRHSVLGQDADSQTTGATLSSRRTHLDQAQAEFRQAEDLTQQANQSSSRGVGVSYDPLKDPGNTNAALALVEAVEAAPSGQRDQVAFDGLKTMGYDQGGQLPSAYQDGTAVRATPEEVQALAQAMMDDPALANQIRALHAGHLRDVPNSGAPVGAGSAAANSNSDLPGKAQDYHDQGKEKQQKAMDYHEAKQESGELRYQGEAGDAAPQSHNVATHNKLMNTAEDAATDDMKLSLQQALPNEIAGIKVPGAKPTLEQFQEKVGYRPDGAKEEDERIGLAMNPSSHRHAWGYPFEWSIHNQIGHPHSYAILPRNFLILHHPASRPAPRLIDQSEGICSSVDDEREQTADGRADSQRDHSNLRQAGGRNACQAEYLGSHQPGKSDDRRQEGQQQSQGGFAVAFPVEVMQSVAQAEAYKAEEGRTCSDAFVHAKTSTGKHAQRRACKREQNSAGLSFHIFLLFPALLRCYSGGHTTLPI